MTNLANKPDAVDIKKDSPVSTPMICLYGRGVANGYAMGRAVVMGAAALEVAHYRIAPTAVTAEKTRFSQALKATSDELRTLAQNLPDDAPRELAALLNVHQLLLSDPLLAEKLWPLLKIAITTQNGH